MNKTEALIAKLKAEIFENLQKDILHFPTEQKICEKYNLSRQTVRKALEELEGAGYLYRVQGSGCFLTGLSPREAENHFALLLDHPDNYYYPELIHQLRYGLSRRGFSLAIYDTEGDFQKERALLQKLTEQSPLCRGLFTRSFLLCESPNLDLYEKLSQRGCEILFLNQPYLNFPFPSLIRKEYEALRTGVRLFKRNQLTKLFGVFLLDSPEGMQRFSAFLQVLREENLSYGPEQTLLLFHSELREKRWGRLRQFLRLLPEKPALIVSSDEIAYLIMKLSQELHLSIPEELSLLSFDESYLASASPVHISSFRTVPSLGAAASDWMIQKAGGKTPSPLLNYELSHYDSIRLL